MPVPDFETPYTPFYCEENIWYLAQHESLQARQSRVVLITGKSSYRKLWCQRLAEDDGLPVLWDYHVVLLTYQQSWQVYDLDTRLPLPLDASDYFRRTFLGPGVDIDDCDVQLRLIDSDQYINEFSSDRSHMISASGVWMAPPPSWPPIYNGKQSNLQDWLNVGYAGPGELMSLAAILRTFLTSDPM